MIPEICFCYIGQIGYEVKICPFDTCGSIVEEVRTEVRESVSPVHIPLLPYAQDQTGNDGADTAPDVPLVPTSPDNKISNNIATEKLNNNLGMDPGDNIQTKP